MTIALPGKYQDVVALEPGRNASVWKASNSNLSREVFLKAYPIPSSDPESALREPKLLQALDHPNLVKIFDADQVEGELLLEMELVNGGSLQDLINECWKSGRWLPVHDAMALVRDVANGVAYMHSRGFLHRDLKPANVMIRVKGSGRAGVVTDLGLASTLSGASRVFSSKHALLYRPTEVWQGKGYSRASDQYQVGLMLFQILGGEIDYSISKQPEADVGKVILSGGLVSWKGFAPEVDRTLRAIIERCLGPEGARFNSMEELALALHNAKKRQANWTRTVGGQGFVLEQPIRGGIDRITVEIERDGTRTASRQRKVNTREFRREGKPITIEHPDLARCRAFRQLLAKRKA